MDLSLLGTELENGEISVPHLRSSTGFRWLQGDNQFMLEVTKVNLQMRLALLLLECAQSLSYYIGLAGIDTWSNKWRRPLDGTLVIFSLSCPTTPVLPPLPLLSARQLPPQLLLTTPALPVQPLPLTLPPSQKQQPQEPAGQLCRMKCKKQTFRSYLSCYWCMFSHLQVNNMQPIYHGGYKIF